MMLSRKILQYENSIMNMLSNEVHVILNMLGVLMLNRVVGDMDGILVVTPKYSRLILGKNKLGQQLTKPKGLLIGYNSYPILYLNGA